MSAPMPGSDSDLAIDLRNVTKVYKGMHVPERYRQESAALSDDQIASWIAQ